MANNPLLNAGPLAAEDTVRLLVHMTPPWVAMMTQETVATEVIQASPREMPLLVSKAIRARAVEDPTALF